MRFYFSAQLVLFLAFSTYATTGLATQNRPQHFDIHQPPPLISLNKTDLNSLQNRRPVLKKYSLENNTQQFIVFRVSASAEKIWQTIVNFESYPEWVKGVEETKVYKQDQHNYYVAFVISHWLLGSYRYSVRHYFSDNGWMKWQLDQSKSSDFSRSRGFWQVIPVADESGAHDVFYSADLHFKKPKAKWLRTKIIKAGLKQASLWVKREAEK